MKPSALPLHNRMKKKPSIFGKKKAEAQPAHPTVKITPVENDPIMEDREDDVDAAPAPSTPRSQPDEEERSPPAEEKADEMSVSTEEGGGDTLSTVKEEPSKEEAEEKLMEKEGSESVEQQETEEFTLDATAATSNDAGCTTPANMPAFCGCFPE